MAKKPRTKVQTIETNYDGYNPLENKRAYVKITVFDDRSCTVRGSVYDFETNSQLPAPELNLDRDFTHSRPARAFFKTLSKQKRYLPEPFKSGQKPAATED